jgi:hypothetical protein
MKRLIVLGGTFFLLCGVSGCGGESYDALFDDIIKVLNDTGKTLSEIKKKDDAEDTTRQERLRKLGQELENLKRRAEQLKNPPDAEQKDDLKKKYHDRFDNALAYVKKEWKRVQAIPGAKAALDQSQALSSFGFYR